MAGSHDSNEIHLESFPLLFTTKTSSPKFPLGLAPTSFSPFLELIRIEKPTGIVLMFWPFAWGLTAAAHRTRVPLEDYGAKLILSLIGAFILRSSACTVNDIFDRKVDAGVERTKNRPIPRGSVSVRAAALFLFAQYVLGVIFFFVTIRDLAFWVALFQLLPLFAIYPLLKRFTHWPQAWLGLAMNFGYVTAWIATTGSIDVPVIGAAMLGCWCWTMLYDTIYACQDIKDDLKMGVRSTAILFGSRIRPLLICFASIFVAMLACVGFFNDQGPAYFSLSVGATSIHLIWQFMTVDLEMPDSCWRNFNRNGQLGWIVWGGLFLDYLLLFHSGQ